MFSVLRLRNRMCRGAIVDHTCCCQRCVGRRSSLAAAMRHRREQECTERKKCRFLCGIACRCNCLPTTKLANTCSITALISREATSSESCNPNPSKKYSASLPQVPCLCACCRSWSLYATMCYPFASNRSGSLTQQPQRRVPGGCGNVCRPPSVGART